MGRVAVQWRKAPMLKSPRYDHSLSVVGSGEGARIFAIWGNGGTQTEPSVEELDSNLSSWSFPSLYADSAEPEQSPRSSVVVPRGSHTGTVVGTDIYVIGGYANGTTVGDVLKFDTEAQEWTRVDVSGSPPPARSSHSATAVGNRIYLFGGHGEKGPLNDVHFLDLETNTWVCPIAMGDPPPPRSSHSADAWEEGKVFVFGGYGEDAPMNDAWVLEVDTPFVRAQRDELGGEVVAWSRASSDPVPVPVVICGPSGVGKGTLINRLMEKFPGSCGFSVSHTTRKPRPGEQHGVHYHFVEDKEEMQKEIAEGGFLEHAEVHGNIYGTSRAGVAQVAGEGKTCILDIDVQGAQQVKASGIPAKFIFIAPPSFEELEKRLRGRGTESEEQIAKRLGNAKAELEKGEDSSLFPHRIVNDDIEVAFEKLQTLIGLGSRSKKKDRTPSPRSGHATCMLGGGKRLFIFGGCGSGGTSLEDFHLLDLSSIAGGAPGTTRGLRWLPTEVLPASLWATLLNAFGLPDVPLAPMARYNHRAVAVGEGEVLVTGGYDGEGDKALGDCAVFSLATAGAGASASALNYE